MPVLLRKKYSGATAEIGDELTRRLRGDCPETFLYVVPTKRKLRELQRSFLSQVPGGIAPAFHLFTVETLASTLHSIINPPKRIISGPIQAVLLLEAIRSIEKDLSYVRLRGRSRSIPQGTFQKILQVMTYLKERGVYLPLLYDEVQHSPVGEQSKLTDILKIVEAYETRLGDVFIDTPGILRELNDRWSERGGEERFREAYPQCDTLFVSGFDEFSDPELTMLYHCSEMKGVGTLISFDYHPENDEVFGHLKENYEKFLEMGFRRESVRGRERSSFQGVVAQHLFRHDVGRNAQGPSGRGAGQFDGSGTITIASARDRVREVELVAKTIKRLVAARPDRDLSAICVSMVQPQLYTQLFREVFSRYDIPANITDRYHLHRSPVIISIMSLLGLPEKNYQLPGIMRALSSPYLRFGEKHASLDAGNIQAVASLLKISGGRALWLRRIEERLVAVRDRRRLSADDFETASLRREEAMLVRAGEDLAKLFAVLTRFDAPMIPSAFKRRLLELLEELRVVESLLGDRGGTLRELEVDARAYEKFIGFIDEFLDVLTMEGKRNDPQPLSFYADRLRQAVSQERYNIRQQYGYGVNVTSFDETRGLNFEVMFMIGLIDGEFPPVYQPEIFFSSSRREKRERYHAQEHRYLFYQALSNFSEHLYLTMPLTVDEKETVPSSFLNALQEIVAIRPDDESLTELTSRGIYSIDELHRYAGAKIGAGSPPFRPDEAEEALFAGLEGEFEHMRRAMAVERSRIAGTGFPEFNGRIGGAGSAGANSALEAFRARVYSVTQLETYGKCPFQYFAHRVLRMKAIEEPEEGLTPIERGDLLHEILFEFYSARRERGKASLAHASDEEFALAGDELFAITRRKLSELNLEGIYRDIDIETLLGSEKKKGVLREFLTHERDRAVETEPEYFEAAFGSRVDAMKRVDPRLRDESSVVAGNVRLRGKIDRIDVGSGFFSIIDYKTGAFPGRKEIDLGISLQLPLYLYAVENILSQRLGKAMTPAAGSYYQLKSPVKETLGIGNKEYEKKAFPKGRKSGRLLADDGELRSVIGQSVAFVNEYVDTIAKGEFPVSPKDPKNVCKYCDFQTTCRIQTRQPIEPGPGENGPDP